MRDALALLTITMLMVEIGAERLDQLTLASEVLHERWDAYINHQPVDQPLVVSNRGVFASRVTFKALRRHRVSADAAIEHVSHGRQLCGFDHGQHMLALDVSHHHSHLFRRLGTGRDVERKRIEPGESWHFHGAIPD
ncbi:hypothetical protein D3C73_1255130 [compost metagenome]